MWAPQFGMTGIQRIHLLRGEKDSRVLVLAGAGVGGGSLNYANTLYRPTDPFYDGPAVARTSPTGAPSLRRTMTRPNGCSAWHPTRP